MDPCERPDMRRPLNWSPVRPRAPGLRHRANGLSASICCQTKASSPITIIVTRKTRMKVRKRSTATSRFADFVDTAWVGTCAPLA